MPTVSSNSSIRREVRSLSQPSIFGTVAMLSAMVMCGKSPICWITYPILRRRMSEFTFVTSSPWRKILPLEGSIRRLIIFIVVVLPQPDGPTKTTISPSYISIERSSTAGSSWAGKSLERFSSRIMVSAVCLSSLVALSVTDPPGSRKFAEHVEERIEDQRQHDDAEYAAKHQVEGGNAADAGEPGEDVLAQPRTAHDGGDRRDTHEEHGGHSHPGNDDRPSQGQLDPQ